MKKKVKNYTTEILAHETIAEVQQMLAMAGATGIAMDYDGQGKIKSLFFKLKVENKEMPFKLPAKPAEVYEILFAKMTGQKRYKALRKQKSLNIAWRIVRDWLESQLTLIQLKQAEAGEVFFAYLLVDAKRTLYEVSKENQFSNLLPSGDKK